jgi:hypothetical protein
MAHTTTGGRGATSNEAHDRLRLGARLVVLLQVLGRVLLHRATDLANEYNTLSLGVVEEQLDDVDVLRAGEWVTTDTNAQALAKPDGRRLRDGLVGERAGAGYDAYILISHCALSWSNKTRTNLAGLVDVSGHDAHLAPARVDHTGAVRAHEAARTLRRERLRDADLVRLRDALGDAHDQPNLSLDSLDDCISRERRRHVEHRRVRLRLVHRLCTDVSVARCKHIHVRAHLTNGAEDGEAKVGLSGLARRDTANHIGAVGESLTNMESTLRVIRSSAICMSPYLNALYRLSGKALA